MAELPWQVSVELGGIEICDRRMAKTKLPREIRVMALYRVTDWPSTN